jgi:acetoin utilization deacetylase AcuC-like enzyme
VVIPTVLSHPGTDLHASYGHPERPERRAAAVEGVEASGVEVNWVRPEEATRDDLRRVHPEAYLDAVMDACAVGARIDADTYTAPDSWHAALLAAGGAIQAVELALAGTPALTLLRPPGHHAEPSRAMGFCLLANGSIAVRRAQALHGVGRVAVVDWDVHHGNGTQAVFYEDPTVLAVSLHQYPLWPMSGEAHETGRGAGAGTTLNVPLPPGTGSDAFLRRFDDEVLPAVERFAPELLVVACGFDAHAHDPLADLELRSDTFGALTTRVLDLAARLGTPAPALLLEGGYDLGAVRDSTTAVVRALAA